MPDPAILFDEDDAIAQVSPAFEDLSGWSETELIGKSRHWLHPTEAGDAHDRMWPTVSPPASDHRSTERTHRYRRRDGSFFWGETVSVPFHGENGANIGHVQIVQDVSARIRRVDGLTALTAFVAEQNAADDLDLKRFLDLGCRYFGLELGALCHRVDEGDHVEAVGGTLPLVAAGQTLSGPARFSAALPCNDGMAVIDYVDTSAMLSPLFHQQTGLRTLMGCPVQGIDRRHGTLYLADRRPRRRPFDGRERHILQFMAEWLAAFKDALTARRSCEQANRRLAQSEESYRIFYEKTPAMLHSIDDNGQLASVSDTWLATLGYERDEVIGRASTDFLTARSKRYAEEVVLPAYRTLGRCDDVDYEFVTKRGDVRNILLSATSQYDDDGNFFRSLAVLLDVTERRRVERSLEEKTAALERSNADLARFAYIASHDLQEPLRRIITYCDLLKEDVGAELSSRAAEIADIIQSGGRRLRLMINDLLTYVRLSKQLDQPFEPVDMSAVLSQALDDLNEEVTSKGVSLDAAHLPLVWGRTPVLKMVFHHLLSNAIEHGGERAPEIDVKVEDAGDIWKFAVADRGIGVDSRHADRIFEIFQSLHVKDERKGSGAGLAMCRLIIERCGGTIWLDRSYRDGARFLFTLPKNKPQSLQAAPDSSLAPLADITAGRG